MVERIFFYRGFEIGLQPQRVLDAQPSSLPALRFSCSVRIRKAGSVSAPDTFALEHDGSRPFADEFDAVIKSCYVAERRIDLHCAGLHYESDPFRFAVC